LIALVTSSETMSCAVSIVSGPICQAFSAAPAWRRAQAGALGSGARSR